MRRPPVSTGGRFHFRTRRAGEPSESRRDDGLMRRLAREGWILLHHPPLHGFEQEAILRPIPRGVGKLPAGPGGNIRRGERQRRARTLSRELHLAGTLQVIQLGEGVGDRRTARQQAVIAQYHDPLCAQAARQPPALLDVQRDAL